MDPYLLKLHVPEAVAHFYILMTVILLPRVRGFPVKIDKASSIMLQQVAARSFEIWHLDLPAECS